MSAKPITTQAKIDPKEMFGSADVYYTAASLITRQVNAGQLHMIGPETVLSAFSLEIFFKCLILIDGKIYGGSHDLWSLFQLISKDCQTKIRANYAPILATQQPIFDLIHKNAGRVGPAPAADFDSVLQMSRNAFERFRYHFEKGQLKSAHGWLAGNMHNSVRRVILEFHPEWANLHLQYGITQPPPSAGPAPA